MLREKDGYIAKSYGQVPMRFDLLDPAERQGYLGIYDPPLSRVIRGLCKPGMTVIDIGANAGIITATAADVVGETGYVLAVEPNPTLSKRLRELATRNPLKNLHVLEVAVADTEGTLPFYVSSCHTYSTLVKEQLPNYPLDSIVQVKVVLLSSVLCHIPAERKVNLLKIDAEGVDARILTSAIPFIEKQPIDVIIVEAFDKAIEGLLQPYATMGYSFHAIHPEDGSLPAWGSIASANDNLVMIHKAGSAATVASTYRLP